jgi:ring-1,2-phenylacetyl-CoA epoxidase subunit PaaD
VELGIVRDAKMISETEAEIIITPTYSACPAMFNIEEDIIKLFKEKGISAKVVTKMFPIWTTDWMTDEAREKLRAYGIVPPEKGADENHLHIPKNVRDVTKILHKSADLVLHFAKPVISAKIV